MKVFVSSTVYDLLDIRAEVSTTLASMGVSPVLSDDTTSEFDTAHATNSIETCLINVGDSDEVIVILDQRYGPRLGKLGFPDVSATHLEYKKARELEKPIHFFVRDRLEADFCIWKKNKGKGDLKLAWIAHEDIGLFNLLEEHRSLTSNAIKNWIITFTNAVDLKSTIQKILEPRIKPARLVEALSRNQFPLLGVVHEITDSQLGQSAKFSQFAKANVTISVTNLSSATAFNYCCAFSSDKEPPDRTGVVVPGQKIDRVIQITITRTIPVESQMVLEYDSAIGVRVREVYGLEWRLVNTGPLTPPTLWGGISLKARTYHNAPEIRLTIMDP